MHGGGLGGAGVAVMGVGPMNMVNRWLFCSDSSRSSITVLERLSARSGHAEAMRTVVVRVPICLYSVNRMRVVNDRFQVIFAM